MAQWLEGLARKLPDRIAKEREWLRLHPDDQASRNQLAYWENYTSVVKQIAYLVRRAGIDNQKGSL